MKTPLLLTILFTLSCHADEPVWHYKTTNADGTSNYWQLRPRRSARWHVWLRNRHERTFKTVVGGDRPGNWRRTLEKLP